MMVPGGKTNLAKTLQIRGRLAEAEALYREVLEEQPANVEALEGLGVLTFRLGRFAEARDYFARDAALRPDSARTHANLGEALRVLGRLDEAADEVRKALELDARLPQSWNTLALLAHGQKRFGDAVSACQEALKRDPRFAAAHINLGNALLALHRRGEAVLALREALRIDPDSLTAHSNLCQALTEQGDPDLLDEAEAHARRALALGPRLPEVLENLGHVLRQQGRLEEALETYKQALALAPRRVPTRRALGELLQQCGRYEEAGRFFQTALALDPADALALASLGSLAFVGERYEDAVRYYGTAVARDPSLAEAHYGLGLAFQELAHFGQAEACFHEALRVDPTLTTPLLALARLQAERAQLYQSCRTARQALELRPNLAEAYWRLSTNLKSALPDNDLQAMQRLLGHKYLSHGLRAALHFGLGTVFDARGLYDLAARHLDAANALQAAVKAANGQSYDADGHSRAIERLIAVFSPEFLGRRSGWGDPDPRPVFVVGLPRSGTTLVEQILASHSQVHGAGELRDAINLFNALPQLSGAPDADPFAAVANLSAEGARELAGRYLRRLDVLAPPTATRVVDKMPDNLKLLGLVAMLWPNAHVILCSRDLRDIAVSCWQTTFATNPWTNTWDHMARRFADHQLLVQHWKRTKPIEWLDISYEALVREPEAHARRLIDFLGLHWEPACLEFHKTRRVVRTASQLQVREPIYSRSVGRWRNYEAMLEPLMRALERYGVSVESETSTSHSGSGPFPESPEQGERCQLRSD